MHPSYQGALLIYFNLIEPKFKSVEENIRLKATKTLKIAFENFIKVESKLRQLLQKERK